MLNTRIRRTPLIFRAGITSVFSGPLRAQSITLIAGVFALAVASMLIYFIFSSLAKSRNGKSRYRATLPE